MLQLRLNSAIKEEELDVYQEKLAEAHRKLTQKTGAGADYLGWFDWPLHYDREEIKRISDLADKWKGHFDVLLVCGIGGSYLGARAALDMLRGLYPKEGPEVIFVGNTFSGAYVAQVLEHLQGRSVLLNVISKSGTTTETAISFRIFRQFMEEKYGVAAKERIFATTDARRGALKKLAEEEGYDTFIIPDDIGGRYSVFTAVGLLPLALCGIQPEEILRGSLAAKNRYQILSRDNDAYRYAVARRVLQAKGYQAEMLVTYDLQMTMVAEWFKQLFGESEGKDGKGLLPCSSCFSTDLHSLGQFIQQGSKILFETCLSVKDMGYDCAVPWEKKNGDGLNYLANKKMSWINKMMREGTYLAHHQEGGVPLIEIVLDKNDAYHFGEMIYFFFIACGISCYMIDINPFNQPGVEIYKKKMFQLLGKE